MRTRPGATFICKGAKFIQKAFTFLGAETNWFRLDFVGEQIAKPTWLHFSAILFLSQFGPFFLAKFSIANFIRHEQNCVSVYKGLQVKEKYKKINVKIYFNIAIARFFVVKKQKTGQLLF